MNSRIRKALQVLFFTLPFLLQQTAPVFAETQEYRIKAAFIYNFAQFVEWPPKENKKVFVIGILGSDPFQGELDTLQTETVHQQSIVVKHFAAPQEITDDCDLLFVDQSEFTNLPRVLQKINGKSILTVGETGHFAEKGGMIEFLLKDNKIRFMINKKTAEQEGLKVNSQLLMLADKVIS